VAGQAQYGGDINNPKAGGRQMMTGSPLRFLGNMLGGPTAANEARALAISGDGSRIVGWSYITLDPLYIQQCYWDAPFTANKTAHGIPFLPGYVWGDATAVSRTGTYVGGMAWKVIYVGGAVDPEGQDAWIWDAVHGTRDLKDVMIAEGADLTVWGRLCDDLAGTPEHGDGFFDITGISEDGRWITGTGRQSSIRHAYVAYLDEAPTVSSITPSSAPNNGPVSVTISGLVFRAGATVKLIRTGYPNIGAYNVTVNSLGSITCSFALANKALGQRNVVVTNTDGQSGTLANGFAVVLPASAPSCGSAIGSALDPVMASARDKYRFRFWGKATVIDPNTIQLDDGSPHTIKVVAPEHGISPGHFASAVGTLTTSAGEPVLLSSSSQVRVLD
jgi:hypothetical protein